MKKNLLLIISLLMSAVSGFASSVSTSKNTPTVFDQLKKVGRVTQHESSANGGKSDMGGEGSGGNNGGRTNTREK